MEASGQGPAARRSRVAIIAAIVIVGLLVAMLLPSYADYEPHARVSAAAAFVQGTHGALDAQCSGPASRPDQDAVRAAVSRGDLPGVVARHRVAAGPAGIPLLELELHEIRWGAPWRRWSAAIPAGATLAFEGVCRSAREFEWRLLSRSTVPVEFLPRALRAQLR
jgi:hypothetical protein